MKVAIVGTTSNLHESQELNARKTIALTLKQYLKICPKNELIVISGGAKGIDTMAIEIAKGLGLKTEIFSPEVNDWNDQGDKYGFRTRNIMIADACDELICITIPVKTKKCYHHDELKDHEKTAGCYTAKKVIEQNKPNSLVVLP